MKFKKREEEISFSLEKILPVKMLEGIKNCINGYKKIKVMILMKHKKLYLN